MSGPDLTARTTVAPPPPTPDKQAQDLIDAHQQDECAVSLPVVGGVSCHKDTDGEAVGRDIAALALRDPAKARAVFDKVMEKTPDAGERREVARGLGQALPQDLLRRLGENADGHAMLDKARSELKVDPNEWASTQIDTALKTADVENTEEFKALDPATQKSLLAYLGLPMTRPATVDNLIALAKSAGFQAASPATRSELLAAMTRHGNDPIFREGLQNLSRDPAFRRLTPDQQATAIRSLSSVAESESYQGKDGSWFFSVGSKSVSDADKKQLLANTEKLVTAQGFQDAGPAAKLAMLDAVKDHAADGAFVGRLANLVNRPGFKALDAGKQTNLVRTYSDDTAFAQGIDKLATDGKFNALAGGDRAKVLGDMLKLPDTKSYKDANATDRQALVEIVGNISAQSAAAPSNTALRNTLNQVLDDKIKLSFYQRAPFTNAGHTFYNWGYANSNGIFLNTDPNVRRVATANNQYIDTLTHETNHKLNGTTTAGTADRFLDEYRAAVVGQETALGRKLTPAEQKAAVDNLVDGTNSDYAHLANLYNHDAKFKAGVDAIYTALNGTTDPRTHAVTTPAATVDPEDARQRLRTAGNDSDYLKKAGNLDNH